MSDRYYLLSKYVKICRQCLTIVSIVVIICQTLLFIVVAEDSYQGLSSSDKVIDDAIIELPLSEDTGGEVLGLSDNADTKLIENDDNGGGLQEINQGSTMSGDDSMMSDIESEEEKSYDDGGGEAQGEVVDGEMKELPIEPPGETGSLLPGIGEILPETTSTNDQGFSETQTQTLVLMTSFIPPNPSPQLSITEVRIDGTDEYIELTNRGDPFVGSISISGVKTSGLLTIDLDLGTNESVVIGDNLAMVIQSGFDIITSQGLSMPDTAARSLQIIYDDIVIDSLDLTSSQVVGSDNLKASREYDFASKIRQVIASEHNRNIILGEHGNPGVVWGLTAFDIVDIGTGAIITGDILTGDITTGTSIPVIHISEVYPFADCVGEHVALSFSAPYSGSLTIAGLGTSDSAKTFDILVSEPGIRYVVESLSGVLSDNVILVPGITLTDGGESLILTDSGAVVLDSIVYSNTQVGQASTFGSLSGDTRIFTNTQVPSIITSCSQSHQTAQIGGCRINAIDPVYLSGVFSTSFAVSGDSLGSSTCDGGQRLVDGALVTSNSCSLGSSFAPGSHRIVYQHYSGTDLICEDEYMIMGAIQAQAIAQNPVTCSSSSSSSYYEALYRKWKLKHDELTNAVEYVGLTVTSNDDVYGTCDQEILSGDRFASMFDPAKSTNWTHTRPGDKLIISNIIANGTGNDRDGTELIEIYNQSREERNIDGLMVIVNNKKVETLTGTLGINSFFTLQDYFPLPNSAGCVAIYSSDGEVYDEVCYGIYKEEQMIDLEYLKAPVSKTKTLSNIVNTIDESDPKYIKSCLQLEEYALLELDLREQKLINKADKTHYQQEVDKVWQILRERTDELYSTYRSITDAKQAYIDRQQSYIDSQQAYIDKLKGQLNRSTEYATRITELYNGNKEYIQTLRERNDQARSQQQYIQRNYPAIYYDPNLSSSSTINLNTTPTLIAPLQPPTPSSSSRRQTLKETTSNLFS